MKTTSCKQRWLCLALLGLISCGEDDTTTVEDGDTHKTETSDDVVIQKDEESVSNGDSTDSSTSLTGDSSKETADTTSGANATENGRPGDGTDDTSTLTANESDTQTESATGGGWPAGTEHPSVVLQMGSSKPDFCNGITLSNDAVYLVGATQGTLGDTTNPSSRLDMFVAKLDFDLKVQWIRQRGTTGDELGRAIALDESENVYVAGTTWSHFDGNENPMPGMGDVFVVKYDSSGRWQWTTTWPTPEDDYTYGIATNASALYVTGATDWETGFVKKFDATGKQGWESLVAVGTLDVPQAVAVDNKTGNVYAAGHSFASMEEGDADAFVVQFSPSGKRLSALTFGTPWRDEIRSMVFDATTSTLVLGGMVEDALPGNIWSGSGDAFVARIGTDLVLKWATQVGGNAFDQAHGVSVAPDGQIFAAGRVDSVFIPDDVHGNIFLAQFEPNGASNWIETWNSGAADFANAVAASKRYVFVCANTPGTLGQSAKGYSDLAIIRLDRQ